MDRKTWWLVGFGVAIRLFFIFPGPLESRVGLFANNADLRNYYWPAQQVLLGSNPYLLWSSGQSGDFRADMAPLELLVYVGTVRIWDDPRAIQVLFVIFDAANILLLGALLRHSVLKLPFQLFYAFGPLTLHNLVLVSEDKTIVLTLSFLIVYLLILPATASWRIGRIRVGAWSMVIPVAALLASFKWLSVFYLFPLLIFLSNDIRDFVRQAFIFGAILAFAHLPWIPDWIYVYVFRAARVGTPLHIAPAVLLNGLGLYDQNMLIAFLVASLLLIYALFWFKRLDIFETIALSMMCGILATPDMDPVHLSIVVICLLLIVNWATASRLTLVWGLSAVVTLVYAISTHAGFARSGLPDLQSLTGAYGSPKMIVLSYLLFVAVFAFYLYDKLRGRPVGRQVLLNRMDGKPLGDQLILDRSLSVE